MFRPITNVNPKTPKAIPTMNQVSYDKKLEQKVVQEEDKTEKKAFEYAKVHQVKQEDDGDFMDSGDFDEFNENDNKDQ